MTWAPSFVSRFVEGFSTSTHVALVETDVGPGYLKAMGGGEGLQTLASELVGTQLAEWSGLPVLEFAIVELDEIVEIPFYDRTMKVIGRATSGPAYITRRELGGSWQGTPAELRTLSNPDDIAKLIVFDTWVMNCDRYSKNEEHIRRNTDNVFFSAEAPAGMVQLKAIDQTHCFTCGHEWTKNLATLDRIRDPRVFGLFPEFRAHLGDDRTGIKSVVQRLRGIDRSMVIEIVKTIPKEWEINRGARDALVEFIVRRASFVADTIEDGIWPQKSLPFPDDQPMEADQ